MLRDVKAETVDASFDRCPTHRIPCPGPEHQTLPRRQTRTVIVDAKGRELRFLQPEIEPGQDRLCPDHEAAALLKQADALWESDPAAAREVYRRLRKDFRLTTTVQADRERIDQRAESR